MLGIVVWMKKSVLLYNEIFVVLTIKECSPAATLRGAEEQILWLFS